MIYEEPKVDVIEFAEGEIVTELTSQPGDGENVPWPQSADGGF